MVLAPAPPPQNGLSYVPASAPTPIVQLPATPVGHRTHQITGTDFPYEIYLYILKIERGGGRRRIVNVNKLVKCKISQNPNFVKSKVPSLILVDSWLYVYFRPGLPSHDPCCWVRYAGVGNKPCHPPTSRVIPDHGQYPGGPHQPG